MKAELTPYGSRSRLGRLGRISFDTKPISLWDRDTATLPYPFRRMRRAFRDFARQQIAPHALAADVDPHSFDVKPLFLEAAKRGYTTMFLPRPWGNLSLYSVATAMLLPAALRMEEFCAACGGLGLALGAHDLGIAPLFVSGDTKALLGWLRKIYAEIKSGQPSICAFAITEPGAGSDVEETDGAESAKLGTFARREKGGWRISGRKVFISDGGVAKWVTLFSAQEGKGAESWTCFLLDKSMPGFSVGRRERKMGQRASDASELILEDVFVPDDRVIGPVGAGWGINRNVLNYSRPVVGAIALGIARGALEHALEFCDTARLGNRPLSAYQDVQIRLADLIAKVQAMRALVWHSTRYRLPFQAAGAIAKSYCADTAWEVCTAAVELLGDHGTLHGNFVEKAARDARLTQIYEGTNQINRLAVIESQTGPEAEFPSLQLAQGSG